MTTYLRGNAITHFIAGHNSYQYEVISGTRAIFVHTQTQSQSHVICVYQTIWYCRRMLVMTTSFAWECSNHRVGRRCVVFFGYVAPFL